jgi:hypothetical protein
MLARKLTLRLNGLEVGTTPMLVPAVSSRTNLDLLKLLDTISELVTGPLLLSAYDYSYLKKKRKPIALDKIVTYPDLIFLDSGGYECNKNQDVSDIGLYKPEPYEWSETMYRAVIDDWSTKIPTVLISFDHPSVRCPIQEQIKKAKNLFSEKTGILKEILIKPESKKSQQIDLGSVINNLELLSSFDIIGFTEKELGYSVLKKMINIATIRKIMDKRGLHMPIHIFGSLDTVTTPLYYLSGADIFDGLSWLRFTFINGSSMYIDSSGPIIYGAQEDYRKVWIRTVYANYNYLCRLALDLEKFQSCVDFNIFGQNADFMRKTYEDLKEKVGGD